MQFGANTWIWTSPLTTAELERLVPHVAGMGFDWIELPVESPNDFDYGRAGELVRAHGLGVSLCAAMGPDRDLIHPDEAIQRSGLAYIRHCIDAAHTVGARNLVGPIYSAVGRTWPMTADERERDTDLLVRQLRSLCEYAGERGVVLCIEPLNRFETSFLNLTAQAIEVVDRVNHPSCKLLLDTFHMNIEEKSLGAAIRAAGERIGHVHACENDRGTPGTGHVPWDDVAAGLHAIGYNGPVVIETFTDKVKTIARAAAIWRALAPDQDGLAREGLAFLRDLIGGGVTYDTTSTLFHRRLFVYPGPFHLFYPLRLTQTEPHDFGRTLHRHRARDHRRDRAGRGGHVPAVALCSLSLGIYAAAFLHAGLYRLEPCHAQSHVLWRRGVCGCVGE